MTTGGFPIDWQPTDLDIVLAWAELLDHLGGELVPELDPSSDMSHAVDGAGRLVFKFDAHPGLVFALDRRRGFALRYTVLPSGEEAECVIAADGVEIARTLDPGFPGDN